MARRYDSQIRVQEINLSGQDLIRKSKVLIIGAGGLGTPVAAYLAASGIGKITIIDGDTILASNLHRQWLYTDDDLGKPKAEILKGKLNLINPEINVSFINEMFSLPNAKQLVDEHDIVCDCTDNVDARLLIDSVCFSFNKPLVYAAVLDWIGYLTILNYKNRIRLTDIFSEGGLQDYSNNNCSINGIVNTTCGVLGSMQASEVLKIILKQDLVLDGGILCLDTLQNSQRVLKIKRTA